MSEYTEGPKGKEKASSFSDVAWIRIPSKVPGAELEKMRVRLEENGFSSLWVRPTPPDTYGRFPTDVFREVGSSIFVYFLPEFNDFLDKLEHRKLIGESEIQRISKRIVEFPIKGGEYLHLDPQKILLYSLRDFQSLKNSVRLERQNILDERISVMRKEGWTVFEVDTKAGLLMKGFYSGHPHDLDFQMSVFLGRDGKTHALAAESFVEQIPGAFSIHTIPDPEVQRGGCNIADLRGGSILIAPNPVDAPTANGILIEYANASIINAPQNFLDQGGGPRCSISSFSLQ